MKERPLIITTELIPKILDGTKTNTRRLNGLKEINKTPDIWECLNPTATIVFTFYNAGTNFGTRVKCPYGQVGDRLWVRETFQTGEEIGGRRWDFEGDVGKPVNIVYKADYLEQSLRDHIFGKDFIWKPSIHMHRYESRITLEITGIRLERQLDITLQDAIKEGFGSESEFNELFLKLNPHLKNENPWVWVIEFKKEMPGIK